MGPVTCAEMEQKIILEECGQESRWYQPTAAAYQW